MSSKSQIFEEDFIIALRTLVNVHHSIYARVPPQGIYFEALVEEAFKRVKRPFTPITAGAKNQPVHDLLVENHRISLKTETGLGTNPKSINITKLCTTEREPWGPEVLLKTAMDHLDRYDAILMLRAIWDLPLLHYQLLEIPTDTLKLIKTADLQPVGYRKGRQSLGADVHAGSQLAFHVHFDGADGKCQIRGLSMDLCNKLLEWDLQIRE